jgi:acyl dehydratase
MDTNSYTTEVTYPVTRLGLQTIAKSVEITPRLVQSAAAAVQETNERYFDDSRTNGLDVHPGLIFSLEWWTRFMPGDGTLPKEISLRGIHAWTDIRLIRPFKLGDIITSQGQLISIGAIPPGTLTVTRWTFSDMWGNLVAEYDKGAIIRDIFPDGEDQSIKDRIPKPDVSESTLDSIWVKEIEITANTAQIYSECAQIYNPIHTEKQVAIRAGLPNTILHGVCTQSIAIGAILEHVCDGDPKQLQRICGEYRAMVLPDSTIKIRVTARELLDNNSTLIKYDVLTESGDKAIDNGIILTKTAE